MDKRAYKEHREMEKRREEFQKKLQLIEEQRRKGQFGQQQKEWQQEQDKLFS